MEQILAMRKRDDVVFTTSAGIDVGGSSHWVAVAPHLAEESVREFGAMTDDLNALPAVAAAMRSGYRRVGIHRGVLDSCV